MTTRSRISKIAEDLDVTSAGQTTTIYPQRLGDELGAMQIELNQDPGGGATGTIAIQGRLSNEASWVTLSSQNISDYQGLNSQIVTDVDIMPQMRLAIVSPGSVTALTTLDAWLQE